MSPFLKYLLVSLLFFVLLTAISYRFLKPRSAGKTALSSQTEAQFTTDAQLLDTLYRSFKLAIKGTDQSILAQTKGNLQGRLSEMQKRPAAATSLDTVFRRVIRNYYSLIKVNEEAVTNQKDLVTKKQAYKDQIEQLTQSNQLIRQQIMIISSQPPPPPPVAPTK
ncbi:hypothetical protein [Runella sp.]|uniref:hypothetical protein n=1 Tax=Runella sp. TaxID=1960881 RepID=UPI003D12747E